MRHRRQLALTEFRENVERELLLEALRHHRGKVTAPTFELGIGRPVAAWAEVRAWGSHA
ncbi:MAG: hypothetical protein JST11_22700 [Acidobacteria bacterium]|nr:hypothetical protein [Acidobacteriota bacterium]